MQMRTISRGLWSGVMATSAMTYFLLYAHRRLGTARPLPPAALTHELQEDVANVNDSPDPSGREDRAMLAHFVFGVSAGILYASLTRFMPKRRLLTGNIFGLGIWSSSYLGWVPALRLSPAAPKAPLKENLMMVAAHLVFGTALALAERNFAERGEKLLDGERSEGLNKEKAA